MTKLTCDWGAIKQYWDYKSVRRFAAILESHGKNRIAIGVPLRSEIGIAKVFAVLPRFQNAQV